MTATATPGRGEIRIRLFGRTDVGQVREHNEDNFLIADLSRASRSLMESDREQSVGPRGTVLGVCDGMGGAAAGEVASQLAVDIIYEKLSGGETPPDHDELARRLVGTIEEAGVRIFNEARADRSRRGMGTTATVAALMDSRLFIAQVGDSRAYLLRGDRLVQVSRDQSLANQLIEAGQLTEEEAENFEHNNIILQALGTAETVQVDLTFVDLRRGDVLLLCSDGLSGMVRTEEIREVLTVISEPMEVCRELTERANRAGGHDNITVIVARFDGEQLPEPRPDEKEPTYQKYALPEPPLIEATQRLATVPASVSLPAPPTRNPKGHGRTKARSTTGAGHFFDSRSTPSEVMGARSASGAVAASDYELCDEPVELPTTGLPPPLVGVVVLGTMVLVAVAGFLLLR